LVEKTGHRKPPEETHRHDPMFRMLFDHSPLPMWIYDPETLAFVEVNDTAVAMYGYSRDEFAKLKITDIRPQEELPRLRRFCRRRAKATGMSANGVTS
jgi:PAS domain S-box-containing protein